MLRGQLNPVVVFLLFSVILLGSFSCSNDDLPDDYLTKEEVARLIEDALRKNNSLSEEEVLRLIQEALDNNRGNLTEADVIRLIQEALGDSTNNLTEAQVRRLIEEALKNSGNNLSEKELHDLIEKIVAENNADLGFSQLKIVPILVTATPENDQWQPGDWQWSEEFNRYEAVFELPELSETIYEKGAVLGYVFIGEKDQDEVQKLLPFVNTYDLRDDSGAIVETYTETISFDIQYKLNGAVKPSVAFFIQASDLARADEYLQDYNFRLVLVW